MAGLDFTEIAPAHAGPDRDAFELFAREFLHSRGFQVVAEPARGIDGGKDLIVEEWRRGPGGANSRRWLVSCKHKGGGKTVGPRDEEGVRDRLATHRCEGFMAFYSTLLTSGLSETLHSLRPDFEYSQYDAARIERELLADEQGWVVALRYMPVSFGKWRTARAEHLEPRDAVGRSATPAEPDGPHHPLPLAFYPGPARLTFSVSVLNHRRRCAHIHVDKEMTQGSTVSRFDVAPTIRFGTMEYDVGGSNVAVGLRRVLLHLTSEHGDVEDGRLGDGERSRTGLAAQAGDVWEFVDPSGGMLTRKALGDEPLCRVRTPDGLPGHARIELTAASADVVCNVSPARAVSRTTEKVIKLFLEGALFQKVSGHLLLSEVEMRSQ